MPARRPAARAQTQTIGYVTLLVEDYDEAIAFFTQTLGFELLEDAPRPDGKRWVLVAPSASGTRLLLAAASTPAQRACIGRQTGGRVGFFLHTTDFAHDYAALMARGLKFTEVPRREPYGTVAVFEDLYGNRWDLLEPSGGGSRRPRP